MTEPKDVKVDDGGPAFPKSDLFIHGEGIDNNSNGMSVRDYFAAKVLQGLCSSTVEIRKHFFTNKIDYNFGGNSMVKAAYVLADMMIAERNKESRP